MVTINKNSKIHLTDDQRQLVAENHNLIYSFLHQHKLPVDDDNYSLAAIGLCKAACCYNPEKGAFSTIAYYGMYSEICHYNTLANYDKRKIAKYTEYYDFSSYDLEEDFASTWGKKQEIYKATSIINHASKNNEFEDDCLQRITYQNFIDSLADKQKEVAKLYEIGFGSSEIAEILGCVPSNITYYKNQIKNKYLQFIST